MGLVGSGPYGVISLSPLVRGNLNCDGSGTRRKDQRSAIDVIGWSPMWRLPFEPGAREQVEDAR